MSRPNVSEQLVGLASISPAQLRIEWRRAFRTSPPELTKDLMMRLIAWKLQVKAFGGLPSATAKLLDGIADGRHSSDIEPAQLKPGTRIVREWNGRLLCVHVVEGGFRFEDRSYGSLSEIAREVTGAHWSGPRFFGLKRSNGRKAAKHAA
jgi:hypothetical protein